MLYRKIDAESRDSVSSALNLFQLPNTNISATKSLFKEWLCVNSLSETPYSFQLHTGSDFFDLSKTYLFVEFHIEKREGTAWILPIAADNPNVVNGFGACFYDNLKITLNNKECYNSNSLQMYKAHIDMLTTYGKEALPHLQAAGFFEEKILNNDADAGYTERREYLAVGARMQCCSRIYADLFLQDRFLLTQSSLNLELNPRIKDNFLLQFPVADVNTYRIVIDNVRLFTKTVSVTDGLALSFNTSLLKTPARYPIKKSEMKSFFISEGRREFFTNLALDLVPRKITLVFVPNNDYVGSTRNTPFNFQNANVQDIQISANGMQYPHVKYEIDFPNNRYTRLFHDFQEQMGVAFTANGNLIDMKKYKTGFTLFTFNLSSSLENEDEFDLLRSGPTSLLVHFNAPVPAGGYSLIVYTETDSILTIDANRTVTTDLTA